MNKLSMENIPEKQNRKRDLCGKAFLEVENLSVSFKEYEKGKELQILNVITDLSISVMPGEILAIAGSSGSGKSLLAHGIFGLLPDNAEVHGAIRYKGEELNAKRISELRGSRLALIPQSVTYLDPLIKVGKQVMGKDKSGKAADKLNKVFQRLGLKDEVQQYFPYQLSGGMARRVLFSTAAVTDADVIVADEPTPGMHLEQAMEALGILRELADEGKAVVLITHDIDLAIKFADRVSVFYAGTTLETAFASDFTGNIENLRHPYSKALWRALPQNEFIPVQGSQPYAGDLPKGCLYAPRCPYKTEACEESRPVEREIRGGLVRCIYAA